MTKKTIEVFNGTYFLLGKDKDGINYYYNKPTWDCGWYWGFGYVATFTNNRQPTKSKDISSHTHLDSSFLGENNNRNGGHCYNLFKSKTFVDTTFDLEQGEVLSELINTAYKLRESAGLFGKNSSVARVDWATEINTIMLPEIFKKIEDLLT